MKEYNAHDEIKTKSGKICYVSEDLGSSVKCFDTDDWNDVYDNIPIAMITIDKSEIIQHKSFTITIHE